MAHLPVVKVLVDWDDDGSYSDRYSDVSPWIINYAVSFGASARLSGKSISPMSANGQFTLWAEDATYDPEASGGLSETQLRKNHGCRILVDGNLFWQGIAQFQSRDFTGAVNIVSWVLQGRHAEVLTQHRVEIERTDGGTVADLLSDMNGLIKVPVSGGTKQPVGIVTWRGSGISLIEAMQRYAGGFCVEDYQGNWSFTRWTDTPDLPVGLRATPDYGPMSDFSLQERVGYVRNFCEAEGKSWSPSVGDSLIAVTSNTMSQSSERVFVLAGLVGRERVTNWATDGNYDIRLTTADTRATAEIVGTPFVIDSNTLQIRVRTNAFGNGITNVTANAYGSKQGTVEAAKRRIDIDLYDSQTVYGERQLALPPWFPGGYDGIHEWTTPWLRNLSQPMLIGRVSYPLTQDSKADTARVVDHLTPGRRAVLSLDTTSFDTFILSATLTGGNNRVPVLTVTGCNVQREPAPPLGVSVEFVADVVANLVVSVEDPNGQTIYGRLRTS